MRHVRRVADARHQPAPPPPSPERSRRAALAWAPTQSAHDPRFGDEPIDALRTVAQCHCRARRASRIGLGLDRSTGLGDDLPDPIGESEEERTTEALSRRPRTPLDAGHVATCLLVQRVVHHLDHLEVVGVARCIGDGSIGRGPEHHPHIVSVGDTGEQCETASCIRTTTDVDLADAKVTGPLGLGGELFGPNAMPGNEFGGLAGEHLGFVGVVGSFGLVEQLANALDQLVDRFVERLRGGHAARVRRISHRTAVCADRPTLPTSVSGHQVEIEG